MENVVEFVTSNDTGYEDVDRLVSLLQTIGCDVEVDWPASNPSAHVVIRSMPTVEEVDRRMHRSKGRYKSLIHVCEGDGLSKEATVSEFLAWYENHTPAEGQRALGLKPATFYRRLKNIRERADMYPDDPLWYV